MLCPSFRNLTWGGRQSDAAGSCRYSRESSIVDALAHCESSDSLSVASVQGAALGVTIRQDCLPFLQVLSLWYNRKIGDEGMMYLAQGLQASSRTKLSELGLNSVGMGNAGFNSLAEAIRSGALSECSRLCACGITSFINVIPFTNGLRSGGLKNDGVDQPEAMAVLVQSLMEHCPALQLVYLRRVEPDTQRFITEIRDTFWGPGWPVIAFNRV